MPLCDDDLILILQALALVEFPGLSPDDAMVECRVWSYGDVIMQSRCHWLL